VYSDHRYNLVCDEVGMTRNSGPSQDGGFPSINSYPNDVAIVSIGDARRRLALADGLQKDLGLFAEEFRRLRRDALEAAGMYDVEATHNPRLVRSLLKRTPVPKNWVNQWVGDLIDLGEIYDSPRQIQALRRVGAFAGIPTAEVRQVIDSVVNAMHGALDGCGQGLLKRLQDVIEQLGSAYADYEHLRDSIAGLLDRMENEQRLRYADRVSFANQGDAEDGNRRRPGESESTFQQCGTDTRSAVGKEIRGAVQSIAPVADAVAKLKTERESNIESDSPRLSEVEARASRQFTYAHEQNLEWSERHPDRSVHEWLLANVSDLPDELKPVQKNFETWSRYLRSVRNAAGSQKNKPRRGRTSRSAIPSSEV
jgi:hypothetical protein